MRLPDHAKRVFRGEIFDVYQWDQEMFDGSTAVFERLDRPDTVCIIPVVGEEILLSREIQPHWPRHQTGLFGGRIDPGERPEEAAKRELLEETGLESDDWELLFSETPVHKMDWTIHYYVARSCRGVRDPSLDAGEDIEVKRLDFEGFVKAAKRPGFRSKGFTYWLLREIVEGRLDDLRSLLLG